MSKNILTCSFSLLCHLWIPSKEEGKLKITWLLKYMYRKYFFWYITDQVLQQSWKCWGFHWTIETRHPLGGQQSWPAGLSRALGLQVAKHHGGGESYWAVPNQTSKQVPLWQSSCCWSHLGAGSGKDPRDGTPSVLPACVTSCHELDLFGTSQCREMHKPLW